LFFIFGFLLVLRLADSGAELLEGLTNTITLDRAELPRGDGESLSDVACILELINELVEDLARLRGLHSHKRVNKLAISNGKIRAIKVGLCGGVSELALCILTSADLNGDLLILLKDIREAHSGPLSAVAAGNTGSDLRASASYCVCATTTRAAIVSGPHITAARLEVAARNKVATRDKVIARLILVCIGAKRDGGPHSGTIADRDGATSKTLDLCLKSGNGGILLGDPHLKVSELGEENRGVINSGVHLGIACKVDNSLKVTWIGLRSILHYAMFARQFFSSPQIKIYNLSFHLFQSIGLIWTNTSKEFIFSWQRIANNIIKNVIQFS
jgi:hypothetical protein